MLAKFFRTLTENGIIIFPYFLAIFGGVIIWVIRKSELLARYGLQIVTIVVMLPAVIYLWNKEYLRPETGTAILSGIVGYVFGSTSRTNPTPAKDPPN